MKTTVTLCDACRLPIDADELAKAPPARRPNNLHEALALSMGIPLPTAETGLHIEGHLHECCREELEALLATAVDAIAQRAARDTEILMRAFRGGGGS